MKDLFGGAPKINGHHFLNDPFRWLVAIFMANGATDTIKRATASNLQTFYPIRTNIRGEYIPLFRNYLFLEYDEHKSLEICRATTNFVRVISARDDEGIYRPILVPRDHIKEAMAMALEGRFNERLIKRRAHGPGSIVRVIEGSFIDRRVRLEMTVTPEMPGNQKIRVDIDGLKATIELFKLAL